MQDNLNPMITDNRRTRNFLTWTSGLVVLLLFFQTCSLNRIIMNTASCFMEDGIESVYQEGDLELAQQFLSSNLKMIEIMVRRDPTNRRLNLLASQAFGSYAMAFVEDENPERASRFYQRGLVYSFQALPPKKSFTKKTTIMELEKILPTYTPKDIPALFWLGYNWGSYILKNIDDPNTLINLAKVEMIMHRVMELDEIYNFAGVYLFYGSFYSARPPMLGGNPEKGREYFLKNIELTQNRFLLGKYFYARYYAVQVQDKALFDSLLEEILDADIDSYPEIRLMNVLAKRKAEELKKNESLYFDINS